MTSQIYQAVKYAVSLRRPIIKTFIENKNGDNFFQDFF